jgi:hypothetical protein
MESQEIPLASLLVERVHAGIFPDIGSVAPELAELDIIAVGSLAIPKDEDELMARSVEGTHATVVFDPDTQVEQRVV